VLSGLPKLTEIIGFDLIKSRRVVDVKVGDSTQICIVPILLNSLITQPQYKESLIPIVEIFCLSETVDDAGNLQDRPDQRTEKLI